MIRRTRGSERRTRAVAAIGIVLALLATVAAGLLVAFGALRGIWREQCRITDPELNVVITNNKDEQRRMVHPEIVTLWFGLTNGANLATIPYAELRQKLIARIPNIHDITITRRLPRRVTVDVREREPAVRIVPPKGTPDSGLVADYDNVVFRTFNSPPLPIIRGTDEAHCKPGQRLEGHARAALQLVRLLAEAADAKSDTAPELASLRVLDIDTSKKDYLLMTLGDYSTAEIAWERMGEDSEPARKSLRRQLVHLAQAIATRLTPRTTRWIATEYQKDGRVYAADPARLGER